MLFASYCQLLEAQEVPGQLMFFILRVNLCGDLEESFYAVTEEVFFFF